MRVRWRPILHIQSLLVSLLAWSCGSTARTEAELAGSAGREAAAQWYIDQVAAIPGSVVKAEARHLPDWGVAMVASARIRAGESILEAPAEDFWQCCIMPWELDESDPLHIDLVKDLPDAHFDGAWCLGLLAERSRGSGSRFHRMIASLCQQPERSFTLDDDSSEIALFHAFHIAIGEGIHDWRACASQLRKLYHANNAWARLAGAQPPNDAAKWSSSAWQTRAFEPGLVPVWGILNHHWHPMADWTLDETKMAVVALRDIEVGEQIFWSYGTFSNLVLLGQYGFAIPDNPIVEAPASIFRFVNTTNLVQWLPDVDTEKFEQLWGEESFLSTNAYVVPEAMLWHTRMEAVDFNDWEASQAERLGWRNMTAFYHRQLAKGVKYTMDVKLLDAMSRWTASDRLVCSEWLAFCSGVQDLLRGRSETHVQSLRLQEDQFAVALLSSVESQLSSWAKCASSMREMSDTLDKFSLMLREQRSEL